MANNTFGGGPADVATNQAGDVASGVVFTVWTTKNRSTQVTNLFDVNDAVLPGFVTSDATGRVQFKASDSYSLLWLWDGNAGNTPWPVVAQEVLTQIGSSIANSAAAANAAAQAEADATSAVTAAQAADNRSTTALDTARAASLNASAALAASGKSSQYDDLMKTAGPYYFAHAGGSNLAPGNTMDAYRMAAGLIGHLPVDLDVKVTDDEAMPCLHDTTVDAATVASGSVLDLSGGVTRGRLRMDPQASFLPTWIGTPDVPDFRDVLRELGGKVLLVPEVETLPGDTAGRPGQVMADAIVREGAQRSCLVQTGQVENIRALVAAGIPTLWLSGYGQHGADINENTAAAEGCEWVGMDATDPANGAATIARFHSAGLKVAIYTLNRRSDLPGWIAAGVDAIWSDDPWYLSGLAPRRTKDPFVLGSYYHGHIAAVPSAGVIAQPRGYYSGGGWGLDAGAGSQFGSVLQGWASPIKGNPAADSFQIDFTTVWETQPNAAFSQMSVFLSPDDAQWDDTLASGRRSGWLFSTRPNGNIIIYKSDGATIAQVGTITGTAVAQAIGAARAFRIVVTPTDITFSVPATGHQATVADPSFRGGFMHLSVTNAKGRFSGFTIS